MDIEKKEAISQSNIQMWLASNFKLNASLVDIFNISIIIFYIIITTTTIIINNHTNITIRTTTITITSTDTLEGRLCPRSEPGEERD